MMATSWALPQPLAKTGEVTVRLVLGVLILPWGWRKEPLSPFCISISQGRPTDCSPVTQDVGQRGFPTGEACAFLPAKPVRNPGPISRSGPKENPFKGVGLPRDTFVS